jgi:hypothetical protein
MGQVGCFPQANQFSISDPTYSKEYFRPKGKWHLIVDKFTLQSSTNMTANRLYFMPFVLQRRTLISGIGFRVTSGVAGARVYWGLYADNGFGYPGSILESGDVVATANRNYLDAFARILEPGLYWIATGSNLTPGVRRIDVTENINALGCDSFTAGGTDGNLIRMLYVDLADIALGIPDPAPAGLVEDIAIGYYWGTYLYFEDYL